MRPSGVFSIVLLALCAVDGWLIGYQASRTNKHVAERAIQKIVVSALGLTDISLATEARYTRHPAVTDMVVPFMDHPGAIEHFPSGSFWTAPTSGR